MQQYMIQIIKSLQERGYRQLNPDSNNVYGRVDGDVVYVVVIGSNRNLDADSLKKFNDKIIIELSINSHKKVNILNILITPNGMFDDMTKKIVENVGNVWLFTEDYGKLYVFENQPTDFDSLYDVIDKKTVVDNRRSQHNLMRMFGVVTPIFLLMNVLVYLACVYIYQPTDLAVNVYAISEKRQYYRFLTSMFTHFGITHLLGNMVILIALGARIENIIGRLNYVIVYIVTGLAAAFASYINFFCNDIYDYSAGASGAIFGLLGVLVVIAFYNKGRVKDLSLMNMLILFILTLVDGLMSEGIDNVAHAVGFMAGILAGIVLLLVNQKVVKNSWL